MTNEEWLRLKSPKELQRMKRQLTFSDSNIPPYCTNKDCNQQFSLACFKCFDKWCDQEHKEEREDN